MSRVELDANAIADVAWDNWWAGPGPAELRRITQSETPVDYGGLRGSVNTKKGPRKTGGQLYADSSYSVPVHEGHGEILPRKPGGVLSWLDRLTGDRVFVRRVGPVAANTYLIRGCIRFGLKRVTRTK
jgi:hypothetical protein